MEKKGRPMIKDYVMVIHLSMAKYHQSKHTGVIEWKGNPCHGKTICVEGITRKTKNGNFGKTKQTIYLAEKDSPMFTTMESFYQHYNSKK